MKYNVLVDWKYVFNSRPTNATNVPSLTYAIQCMHVYACTVYTIGAGKFIRNIKICSHTQKGKMRLKNTACFFFWLVLPS